MKMCLFFLLLWSFSAKILLKNYLYYGMAAFQTFFPTFAEERTRASIFTQKQVIF